MKINKLLILSALVMGGAFAACTDEADYNPATAEANSQVFFSNETANTVDLKYGENSFTVPVFRANTKGDLTVSLVATDPSGLFNVAKSVTFADGKAEAFIDVTYDFNKITPNEQYPVSISLQNKEVGTLYGNSTISLIVCYAPWSAWEKAGTCDFEYAQLFSGIDPELELEHRASLLDPDQQQFRVLNALYGVPVVINYNAKTNACSVPSQFTGYTDATYGDVYICDPYVYWEDLIAEGKQDIIESNYPGMFLPSFYDPETGKFTLDVMYVVEKGFFGYGYEYVQRSGFAYYNLDLAVVGHFVDPEGADFQLISVEKSEDVASYKVDIFKGQLDDEQLEAAAKQVAESSKLEVLTESTILKYQLQEDYYTVVAVGFNSAREVVTKNYIAFEFTAADPVIETGDWQSLGEADYEDGWIIPAYNVDPAEYPYQVEAQYDAENPNLIRIVNPYTIEDCPVVEMNLNTKKANIVFDCTYPECVVVNAQACGFTEKDYGKFLVYNFEYFAEQTYGVTPEDIIDAGANESLYVDDMIYIPSPMWAAEYFNYKLGYWWNFGTQDEPEVYATALYLADAPAMKRPHASAKRHAKALTKRMNMSNAQLFSGKGMPRAQFKKDRTKKVDKQIIGSKNL